MAFFACQIKSQNITKEKHETCSINRQPILLTALELPDDGITNKGKNKTKPLLKARFTVSHSESADAK
jgi:hypothetical protein